MNVKGDAFLQDTGLYPVTHSHPFIHLPIQPTVTKYLQHDKEYKDDLNKVPNLGHS